MSGTVTPELHTGASEAWPPTYQAGYMIAISIV